MRSAGIFWDSLSWCWGNPSEDGEFRSRSTILRSENGWEDLVQQVNSVVSEFTKTLREAKGNYNKVVQLMPRDVEKDIDI
jgi:hypothetical protein